MSYQKPELFVLSVATVAVRGVSTDSEPSNSDGKAFTIKEGSSVAGDGASTSSTSAAYEADE